MKMDSTALVRQHLLALFLAFSECCLPSAKIERDGLKHLTIEYILLSITVSVPSVEIFTVVRTSVYN